MSSPPSSMARFHRPSRPDRHRPRTPGTASRSSGGMPSAPRPAAPSPAATLTAEPTRSGSIAGVGTPSPPPGTGVSSTGLVRADARLGMVHGAATRRRPGPGPGHAGHGGASPPDPARSRPRRSAQPPPEEVDDRLAHRAEPEAARPGIPPRFDSVVADPPRSRARAVARYGPPPRLGIRAGHVEPRSRTRPPPGCRKAARAALASGPHSAPVVRARSGTAAARP